MSMKVRKVEYGAPAKQILAIPDHYVALGFKIDKATSAGGMVVSKGGRLIVEAGTIYPANDSTAIGVVLNEYDVTDGDVMAAVVIHGFVKTAALPALPSSDAIGALKQITFNPMIDMGVSLVPEAITAPAGAKLASTEIRVGIEGATFRPAATLLESWTFTGEATVKIKASSIALEDNGKTAVITVEGTANAADGELKAVPLAVATSTGQVPSAAVTLVTVATA